MKRALLIVGGLAVAYVLAVFVCLRVMARGEGSGWSVEGR